MNSNAMPVAGYFNRRDINRIGSLSHLYKDKRKNIRVWVSKGVMIYVSLVDTSHANSMLTASMGTGQAVGFH